MTTTARQIHEALEGAQTLIALSGEAMKDGDMTQAGLCVQQSIAGSLLVIATILDRVTRHGERLDVTAEVEGR